MSRELSVGERTTKEQNPKRIYTSRLQKGGALLEDMRFLVREWEEGSNNEQRQRLIVENVLGKKTRARASDVYTRSFSQRFIKGDPPEAWKILRPLEDREVHVEILRPVYYWITARSEPLLYDFVSEEIIAKSSDLDLSVRVDETSQWINNRLLTQDQTWTETVTLKVSRGLLAALRDFGILEGASKKRIAPVYLPVESFVYIAFNLHTLGNSGERLVTHPDWRLFLMQPFVVERLFLDAHQNRLLHYEAAGKIYRIEFPAKTVEEMADDKNGTKKGYVQKDFLFKDTKIIYDQKGRKKGYLKQDYLFKDRINIFDKRGRKKGYLQKDPVFEDKTDIYKR